MEFIIENADVLLGLAAAIVAVLVIAAKKTETEADDQAIGIIQKILNFVILSRKNKQNTDKPAEYWRSTMYDSPCGLRISWTISKGLISAIKWQMTYARSATTHSLVLLTVLLTGCGTLCPKEDPCPMPPTPVLTEVTVDGTSTIITNTDLANLQVYIRQLEECVK